MEEQIGNNKKLVVCTHGKGGATAYTSEQKWIEVPIIKSYKLKNSNGAGDSFFSGFLYGFSMGYETKKCMQFGTNTAGLCVGSESLTVEKLSQSLIKNEYQKHYIK